MSKIKSIKTIYRKEYVAYLNMIYRCYNPTNIRYKHYGGKGIKVSSKWLKGFKYFFEDLGPCNGLTLDRINNSKDYKKSNCRWADTHTQMNNQTKTIRLSFMGITQSLSDWTRCFEVKSSLLSNRYKYGWDKNRILTTPNSYLKYLDIEDFYGK